MICRLQHCVPRPTTGTMPVAADEKSDLLPLPMEPEPMVLRQSEQKMEKAYQERKKIVKVGIRLPCFRSV